MERAYSTFDIKSLDQEQGIIEGIASTPTPDVMGHVMVPEGASFKLPMPLLWQHDQKSPLGHVIAATVTPTGIRIKAKFELGILPDIDRVWTLVKSGLVRGLSIGWKPLEMPEIVKTGDPMNPSLKFKKWLWGETSAVTLPANRDTSIQMIKSICTSAPLGTDVTKGALHQPAVVGVSSTSKRMSAPISEQISVLQRDLLTKSGRFQELIDLEGADGTLEEAQVVERDTLKGQIKSLSSRVDDLRTLEGAQAAQTRQVFTKANTADTTDMPYRPQIQGPTMPQLEKGVAYARAVICKIRGQMDGMDAYALARKHYPNHEALHLFLKEDVPAASTRDTTWAGSLVYPENLAAEFVDWLRPQTIIGRLPVTRIPFNVRINKQTSAGAGYWTGEGRAKPLTWWGFSPVTFGEYKVANIAVLTQELARFSSPSAETLVRNELAAACLERLDRDFVDPNKAISAGVSPASITNGIVNQDSTGTALTNVLQDATKLFNLFADNNTAPTHWIMSVRNAIALSLMVTAQGVRAFPEMSANGGTFAGLPVVVSNYVTHGTPLNNFVILVAAPDIWVADDGGFTIDASREASLEMNDAPTMTSGPLGSPTGATGSVVVSMFQTNSIAIRCERFINWARKRDTSVQWLDDVNWTAS